MFKHGGLLGSLAVLGLSLILLTVACGPVTPVVPLEQVQIMVATSVAQTVVAQNYMGTAVAMTVSALAPTATVSPTEVPLNLPSFTPSAISTPFATIQAGAGTAKKTYSCDAWTVKPADGTAFKPGDPFDIKWIITNTGTGDMHAGLDLEYLSGAQLTTNPGTELPYLKPHDTYTFTADGTVPLEKGRYVMTWKVEGGLCFPYVVIVSGRPGIDP